MHIKYQLGLAALTLPSLLFASHNPCDVDCTMKLIAQNAPLAIGNFTSASWAAACPQGEAGLQAGCLIGDTQALNSPIAPLVSSAFGIANTVPNGTADDVFIQEFPAGYFYSQNTSVTPLLDSTNTSGACALSITSGLGIFNGLIYWGEDGGTTSSSDMHNFMKINQPIPALADPSSNQVPLYLLCVGVSRDTPGAPASLDGITTTTPPG